MTDIMLTLDTTQSMGPSRSRGAQAGRRGLRQPVQPQSRRCQGTENRGRALQGVGCSWNRGPTGGSFGQDGDEYIDIIPVNEYVTPCFDQYSLLSGLTLDKAALIRAADDPGQIRQAAPGTGGCRWIACSTPPGDLWDADRSVGRQENNVVTDSTCLGLEGLAPSSARHNQVVRSGYNAWSCANGGRNDCSGEGWAKKVLVYMTDGENQAASFVPENADLGRGLHLARRERCAGARMEFHGTDDDVGIWVVGYFDAGTFSIQSDIFPHPCPGPLPPSGQLSTVDNLLISSWLVLTPGTCDHYLPLQKTESLPQLLQVLASKIARSRLISVTWSAADGRKRLSNLRSRCRSSRSSS